ncbi:hypothetical protein KUCAC02_005004 [Chaenocephalus aceratus]|uniref:Uncharacterized protein n=1 Tax=Chaenocephalus aceratus TaxID=36190 RepID=A0ACB9WN54_CHAAC|nr:hypothetical protein KUCAC02_005004 [Chaenocephalus aceratus]
MIRPTCSRPIKQLGLNQRRHTLSEVTNQRGLQTKVNYSLLLYPRRYAYSFLERSARKPSNGRPDVPAQGGAQSLPHQLREGRRASDTSLTQGLVAFRQHLQNLARTKGILELNKVQMLVEQMGSGEGATMGPPGTTAPLAQPPGGRGIKAAGGPSFIPRWSASPVPQTEFRGHNTSLIDSRPTSWLTVLLAANISVRTLELRATAAGTQDQSQYLLDPALLPLHASGDAEAGGLGGPGHTEGLGLQGLDSEMMETVDSQHGFVLVKLTPAEG